jgi:hypothetical protein
MSGGPGSARIVLVPGLAARGAAVPAAEALRDRGHDVTLLRAPSWRGTPADLELYGARLAASLDRSGTEADLLAGLSVGTQAAAAAAVRTPLVRRLLLVSPTVDPELRTAPRLLRAWLRARGPGDPGLPALLPEWFSAGSRGMLAGLVSAVRIRPLEDVLPSIRASLTIAHAEHDGLGRRAWAERLAQDAGGHLVPLPGAYHSWPAGDPTGFADLVEELVAA